jgi:hypothetical protein
VSGARAFGKRRRRLELDLAADICEHISQPELLTVSAWEQPHASSILQPSFRRESCVSR